jgi:hypothetical protein
MIKDTQNKMINESENKEVSTLQDYVFPDHGVTVQATSHDEAVKKLEEIINKNKK